MALINCKECGFKISDKAPACVHCGAPVPTTTAAPAAPASAAPKKKPKSKALWLIPLIAVALVAGWFGGLNKEFESMSTAISPPKAPAIASAPQAISVNAVQLYQNYKTNKASADAAYKGKNLQVNGVIDAINKNIPEAPYLIISGGAPSKMVRAYFLKSEIPKLSPLTRGQKIALTCIGDSMLAGSPILRGCVIVVPKVAPPTP